MMWGNGYFVVTVIFIIWLKFLMKWREHMTIFYTTALTAMIALIDTMIEKKFFKYLVFFFLIAGFFYTQKANAIEFHESTMMIYPGDEDYVNPSWNVEKKYIHHAIFMNKYFQKSKDIVWFMPSYNDSEKAKMCFATAVSLSVPPHNVPKIIAIVLGLFTQYGLDCIDAFHEANHYLHRANYHAEMCSFYYDMIPEEGGDEEYCRGYRVEHIWKEEKEDRYND